MEFLAVHWEEILILVIALGAGQLGRHVLLLRKILKAVIAGVESAGHVETKRNITHMANGIFVEKPLNKLVKRWTGHK